MNKSNSIIASHTSQSQSSNKSEKQLPLPLKQQKKIIASIISHQQLKPLEDSQLLLPPPKHPITLPPK
jgi:hypothetical protein